METKLVLCNCGNEHQDKAYGNGRRVHNPMVKDKRLVGWRCTVCGNKVTPTKGDQLTEKVDK